MKITCILQVPYRHLPDDFEKRFESVVTTPYHALVETEKVGDAYRDTLAEFMHAARAGFDGLAITEHGQSSYDMAPTPIWWRRRWRMRPKRRASRGRSAR